MASSPDSYPVPSPDSRRNRRASLDSAAPDRLSGADLFAVGLGAAVDLFLAAKAAEGVSPRTVEWYRYITGRAVRRFGPGRPLDGVGAPELAEMNRGPSVVRSGTAATPALHGAGPRGRTGRHRDAAVFPVERLPVRVSRRLLIQSIVFR